MIELKRCPFCGGEGYFKRVGDKTIWMVVCSSCGKSPVPYNKGYYSKRNAAEDWNRRVK